VFIARYTINIHKKCNYTVCCECFFLYFILRYTSNSFFKHVFVGEYLNDSSVILSLPRPQASKFHVFKMVNTSPKANQTKVIFPPIHSTICYPLAVVKIDFFVRKLDRVSKCRWRLIFSVQYKIYY